MSPLDIAPDRLSAAVTPERYGPPVPPLGGVVLSRDPFSGAERLALPEGLTIAAMIDRAGFDPILAAHCIARINGVEVARQEWSEVKPDAGDLVEIALRPAGGDVGRTLLQVAVFAIAVWAGPVIAGALGFTGSALAATIATAATNVLGNLLINALVPPDTPDAGTAERKFSVDGAGNQARPWGPVPILFGDFRVYPNILGVPVKEIVGDDVYLRYLLDWGPGPISLAELKIGETDLDDFEGVQIQHHLKASDPPVTLYARDYAQTAVDALLDAPAGGSGPDWINPGDWVERTTQADCEEISVILSFPQGVGSRDSKGHVNTNVVSVDIEWRASGSSDAWSSVRPTAPQADAAARAEAPAATSRRDFLTAGGSLADWIAAEDVAGGDGGRLTYRRNKPGEPFFKQITWFVPRGQYDVRVRRATADNDQAEVSDDVYWNVLQSASFDSPIPNDDLAVTALRIKATDQLNGFVDSINAVASRIAPSLNPALVAGEDPDFSTLTASSWSLTTETRNPADAALFLMRGPQAANPPDDDEIDWPALGAFWKWCKDNDYFFDDWMTDSDMRRDEALGHICAAGRGRAIKQFGKWSVVIDGPKADGPVQMFTQGNALNFACARTFPAEVHALRIAFANRDKGYRADERLVFLDGYDESTASKYESLRLRGATDADQVWRLARFHLYTALGQTERYSFTSSLEHLTSRLGDLVALQHNVIAVGQSTPRVVSLTLDGSDVTHITFDAPIAMQDGKTYGVRWRSVSGGVIHVEATVVVVTAVGESATVELETPLAEASAPLVGDLVVFGESGKETLPALIKSIRPTGDLDAEIECVAYASERFAADEGAVPTFTSYVTEPFEVRPAQPTLKGYVSTRDAINVHFYFPPTVDSRLSGFRVRWRPSPHDNDTETPWSPPYMLEPGERVAVIPAGEADETYDAEIVAVDISGRMSPALIVTDMEADAAIAAPNNCYAAGLVLTGAAGAKIPALECSCDPSDDVHVELLEVEIRLGSSSSDADWRAAGTVSAAKAALEIAGQIYPGATYDVAFSFRGRRNLISERTIAKDVDAPAVFTAIAARDYEAGGGIDAQFGLVYAEIIEAYDDAIGELDAAEAALSNRMVALEGSIAENLIADPEFSLGPGDWTRTPADETAGLAIDLTLDPPALVLDFTASGAGEAARVQFPGLYPAEEAARWQASADVTLAGVASSVALVARWYDAAGDEVTPESEFDAGASGRLAGILDAPATAATMRVEAVVAASGAGAGEVSLQHPLIGRAHEAQSAPSGYLAPDGVLTARLASAMASFNGAAQALRVAEARALDAEASIRTLETVRVSDVEAFASLTTQLQVSLDGNAAAITVISEASIELDERMSLFYGVVLDANGHIGGLTLMGKGESSAGSTPTINMVIAVDKFYMGKPGAATKTAPFFFDGDTLYLQSAVIQDATITNAKIANLTLGTEKLQNGAISITDYDYTAAYITVAGTTLPTKTFYELASAAITSTGKPVLIWASAVLDPQWVSSGSMTGELRLLRDGAVIWGPVQITRESFTDAAPETIMFVDVPAAGERDYAFEFANHSGTTKNVHATNRILAVLELKK